MQSCYTYCEAQTVFFRKGVTLWCILHVIRIVKSCYCSRHLRWLLIRPLFPPCTRWHWYWDKDITHWYLSVLQGQAQFHTLGFVKETEQHRSLLLIDDGLVCWSLFYFFWFVSLWFSCRWHEHKLWLSLGECHEIILKQFFFVVVDVVYCIIVSLYIQIYK